MSDDHRSGTGDGRDDGPIPGFEDLYRDRPVPEELEDRIVADLAQAGLLGAGPAPWKATGRRTRPWGNGWFQAAAGLVLFGLGWGGARLAHSAAPAPPPAAGVEAIAPRFMFLLWEDPSFADGAPAGAVAEEYAAWARTVAGGGTAITGNELAPARALVAPRNREDGNTALPEGARLGGYFIVEAPTADQARALAEGHPHGGYGGWIEVAPIVTR